MNPTRPDEDLTKLSAEDLGRVVRWVEDRLINAITPLDVRLQMELPGTIRADWTLQAAQAAVRKVMAAVEEVRALSREPRMQPQMNADERK